MSQKTDTVVACTIGIDTGKNTLHLIGLDDKGAIVLREKLTRGRIAARLANVRQCLIGIEAGMATHCVARELIALGHDVKQVPPVYAEPFRQGHKNDFRDAHAIAEAVQRPSTRCVPVKTDDQLDLQAYSWSGRIEARIGLRMMPTFPRSSLSFRTAGFPQYGWKAGISGGTFPKRQSA